MRHLVFRRLIVLLVRGLFRMTCIIDSGFFSGCRFIWRPAVAAFLTVAIAGGVPTGFTGIAEYVFPASSDKQKSQADNRDNNDNFHFLFLSCCRLNFNPQPGAELENQEGYYPGHDR